MTTDHDHTIIRSGSLVQAPAADDFERIGRVGEFWATHYINGWSVYGDVAGLVATGLTRYEADNYLARYEHIRTHKEP